MNADLSRCEYCREPDDRSMGLLVLASTLDGEGRCVACRAARLRTQHVIEREQRRGEIERARVAGAAPGRLC